MGSVVEGIGRAVGVDLGGSGAKDAAIRNADQATARAEDFLKDNFTLERGVYNPYYDAGKGALSSLLGGNYQADPGYQFRLNQGLTGINNALAARGLGNSGRTLKALTDYNQNFASNEYGNWWNRMSGLAGMGFNAAQALGQGYARHGQGMADLQLGRANANAAAESAYQGRLSSMAQQAFGAAAAAATGGASLAAPGGGMGGVSAQGGPAWMNKLSSLAGYA